MFNGANLKIVIKMRVLRRRKKWALLIKLTLRKKICKIEKKKNKKITSVFVTFSLNFNSLNSPYLI